MRFRRGFIRASSLRQVKASQRLSPKVIQQMYSSNLQAILRSSSFQVLKFKIGQRLTWKQTSKPLSLKSKFVWLDNKLPNRQVNNQNSTNSILSFKTLELQSKFVRFEIKLPNPWINIALLRNRRILLQIINFSRDL